MSALSVALSFCHHPHRGRAGAVVRALVAIAVLAAAGAGCSAPTSAPTAPAPAATSGASSAPPGPTTVEVNPSGDIPDNQAYVAYASPDGLFAVSVPEGLARSTEPGAAVFTDKLNTIRAEEAPRPQAPSEASARSQDEAALRATVPGFQPGQVTTVTRTAGPAVMLAYEGRSAPDPVTGKSVANAVERYMFWRAGAQVTTSTRGAS